MISSSFKNKKMFKELFQVLYMMIFSEISNKNRKFTSYDIYQVHIKIDYNLDYVD